MREGTGGPCAYRISLAPLYFFSEDQKLLPCRPTMYYFVLTVNSARTDCSYSTRMQAVCALRSAREMRGMIYTAVGAKQSSQMKEETQL